jgi:SecD/SecF fusion protein
MKSYFIIAAIVIAAFSAGGFSTKKSYDYKVSVVPMAHNSAVALTDMNKAAEVINRRLINFFGIPADNIKPIVTEDQILLTISKIDTGKIRQIRNVITGYSKLEFWETYENREILASLRKANNTLRDMKTNAEGAESKDQNPLFARLSPMLTPNGEPLPSCMIGLVNGKDTAEINRFLKMDQVKAVFPADIKFYWSAKPYKYDASKSSYGLHVIKVTTGNRLAPLDGSAIISAETVAGSEKSGAKIRITMDSNGASTWAGITRKNIGYCIAVVYDDLVRSYPRVSVEITGGKTEITGDFTSDEANELVNILKSGELPFKLLIANDQIIERE